MLYNYNQCLEKYKTDYKLNVAINNNEIFKLGNGLYSDKGSISDFEFLTFSRPDAVFTMNTAFFVYGLIDEIPNDYDLAIDRLSSKTKYGRCQVKYYYQPKKTLNIGKIQFNYNGIIINIYDKERLLIELFRYSTKVPFDIYKEVVINYRNMDIDLEKLEKYAKAFRTKNRLLDKLRLEIL